MGHTHIVKDDDKLLLITPCGEIINTDPCNCFMTQGLHNAQIITFRMPRFISGHDMMLCQLVEIHTKNSGMHRREWKVVRDVFRIHDLRVDEEDENQLIFTWSVERSANSLPDELLISVQFQCVDENEIVYEWGTREFNGIMIKKRVMNEEALREHVMSILYELQSDMDQNDPEALNYVHNRKFWIDDEGKIHHIPVQFMPPEWKQWITDIETELCRVADSEDEDLDQLSEVVDYIKANRANIERLFKEKVNISDIINDLISEVTDKPLSANMGKVLKTLLDGLKLAFDTHNTDEVRHITAEERAYWNSVERKANTYTDNEVSKHNTGTETHKDIRDLITGLTNRLNVLADSDDTTLDQLSEIVAYIKSNKSLIEEITITKVNVSDIVNDLETNIANKPLSAAQGVVIKTLIGLLQQSLDALSQDYNTHKSDEVRHITADERAAWNASEGNANAYTDKSVADHNVGTDTHNDIRLLIEGLTTRLNTLADSDDTTLDQMSEMVAYIKANRSLIESITTSKVNVSDIIDNLTTNVSNKPVSAAQAVVLKGLIDALQTAVNSKAAASDLTAHTGNTSNPHNVTAAQVGAYSKNETDTKLSAKANTADIAVTKYVGTASESPTYHKIYDFGQWGSADWMKRGFSMLITSRAGELIWVSLACNDSAVSAGAFRLINRYTKIANVYYSIAEHAIYVKTAAWANNVCAHILSNVNGDYVPTVSTVSALASDAVEINIVEFGINSTSAVVGDSSVKLEMGGSEAKPTYNGKNMALDTIVTVDATSGAKSLTFTADNSNNEWRYVYASGITSLTLASSGSFANAAEAYYSVVFLSGTTATTITNTLGAYFTGDDCLDGSFNPMSSKTYDVGIWWNGVKWQAVVRGV